jgi:hypothetical protein
MHGLAMGMTYYRRFGPGTDFARTGEQFIVIMGKKSDTAKTMTAVAESPASATKTTKPAPGTAAAPAKPEAASKQEATAKPEAVAKAETASPPAKDANGAPPKTAKKKPAKKEVKKKTGIFSTEDISLRAYFIAEHRQRHGLHGDSHSDWIEAERQLKREHRKKAAKKKKPALKKRA